MQATFTHHAGGHARRRASPQARRRGRDACKLFLILLGTVGVCFFGSTLLVWLTSERLDPSEWMSEEDGMTFNVSRAALTPPWATLSHAWEQRGGGADKEKASTAPRHQLPPGQGLHLTLSSAEARAAVDLFFEQIDSLRLAAINAAAVVPSPAPLKRRGWLSGGEGLGSPPLIAAHSSSVLSELRSMEADLLLGLMRRVWQAHPPAAAGDASYPSDHCSTSQASRKWASEQ